MNGTQVARAVRIEVAEAVANRPTVAIAVDTGQRGQDIGRGVGDERGVVIGEQRAIVLNKVKEMGHLLKIRGNVGIVTGEVGVVELDGDHMLNGAFG